MATNTGTSLEMDLIRQYASIGEDIREEWRKASPNMVKLDELSKQQSALLVLMGRAREREERELKEREEQELKEREERERVERERTALLGAWS